MADNVDIIGKGKWKEIKDQGKGVEYPGLYITQKGGAAKVVGAPEGYGDILQGGCKKGFHRIKPAVGIAEEECLTRKNDRVKEKDGQAESEEYINAPRKNHILCRFCAGGCLCSSHHIHRYLIMGAAGKQRCPRPSPCGPQALSGTRRYL